MRDEGVTVQQNFHGPIYGPVASGDVHWHDCPGWAELDDRSLARRIATCHAARRRARLRRDFNAPVALLGLHLFWLLNMATLWAAHLSWSAPVMWPAVHPGLLGVAVVAPIVLLLTWHKHIRRNEDWLIRLAEREIEEIELVLLRRSFQQGED